MSVSQPVVASTALITPADTVDNLREAERCVEVGHYLSQQGQYHEAELLYRKAIELKPEISIAHNNLGWVQQMQGDRDGAVASYRRALQLAPCLRIARRNLAPLLVQLGRLDESIDLWHAEMLSGDDGQAWADEMISNAMGERDLTLAGQYANLFARIRCGSQWYPPRPARTPPQLSPLTPDLFLSIPKLLHDIEQFLYLQRLSSRFRLRIQKWSPCSCETSTRLYAP